MSTFTIDFFELSFLAEACIPPRPIARTTFWYDLINKHYHAMTDGERIQLYGWITNNPQFALDDEDCRWFADRFNPDNQYVVTTNYNGEETENKAFKRGERYYIGKDTFIADEYVTSVKKL